MISDLLSNGDYTYFFLLVGLIIIAIIFVYVLFTSVIRKQAEKKVKKQRINMTMTNDEKQKIEEINNSKKKKKKRKKKANKKTEDEAIVFEEKEEPKQYEPEIITPIVAEDNFEEELESLEQEEIVEESEDDIEEPKTEIYDVSPTKEVNKKAVEEDEEEKPDLGRYHVLYRKEDRVWYVKREGSNRIIKVLETQKEAIAYATIKAINQDTSLVIHKMDGKIRKQSY